MLHCRLANLGERYKSSDSLPASHLDCHMDPVAMTYQPTRPHTAALVLANGEVFYGDGIGHVGSAVGEVCFNTAMTGYQEILTDPSYAAQIVCFTFPHVGNTGTTIEDEEASSLRAETAAVGAIFRAAVTPASNWRSDAELGDWLAARRIIGLSGVDTRALTSFIRDNGMPNGVIAHNPAGAFDIPALTNKAQDWAGLVGAMRNLVSSGLAVTVVPGKTSAEDILALKPDGVVLSNGPGDPEATGEYAIPTIQVLVKAGMPMLGICLGHQMLALALGAKTVKMAIQKRAPDHRIVFTCSTVLQMR